MALLPRLRHRLAREARRLAGALLRLADGAEPEPLGPGDPPAHWLAVVRARAPQLLAGRGIGVRVEEVVEPEPGAVGEAPAPGPSPGVRHPDWLAVVRSEAAGPGDWPEAADAAATAARWPDVGIDREPPARSRAPAAELSRPEWPALPDADPARPEWPGIEPVAAVGSTWPLPGAAAPAPPEWLPARRGEPPVPEWPAVGSAPVQPAAARHERARPVPPWTGSWPAPLEPPPGAVGRWPVSSRLRRPSVESGVVDDGKPTTTTPRSVGWAGSDDASEDMFDAGTRGRWPSLPDDEEQRRLPVALDSVDGERVRRLDAEQRGR